MSKPVGELTIEPEPSPRGESINYARLLRHDLLLKPEVVSTRVNLAQVASLHLFREGESYSVEGEIANCIGTRYRKLENEARCTLEYKVKNAMAYSALLLDDSNTATHSQFFNESSAIMNNQPLWFEPYENAMLKGTWGPRQRLYLEASEVSSPEQRLILLGGLAAFINFMNEQK